jgi:hypothetical protein
VIIINLGSKFSEQTFKLQFCVRLGKGKSCAQSYEALKLININVIMPGTQASEWLKRLREGIIENK